VGDVVAIHDREDRLYESLDGGAVLPGLRIDLARLFAWPERSGG